MSESSVPSMEQFVKDLAMATEKPIETPAPNPLKKTVKISKDPIQMPNKAESTVQIKKAETELAKAKAQEAQEVRKTATVIGMSATASNKAIDSTGAIDENVEDTPQLRVQYQRQIREYETAFSGIIHPVKPKLNTAPELKSILDGYQDQMAVHRASAAFVSGIPYVIEGLEGLNEKFQFLIPGISIKGASNKWKGQYDDPKNQTLRDAVRELEILYSPWFRMRPEMVVLGAIGTIVASQITENSVVSAVPRAANPGSDELYPDL
jgi:hypothetical protein